VLGLEGGAHEELFVHGSHWVLVELGGRTYELVVQGSHCVVLLETGMGL
jgi:hypothetical protein